MTFKLRAAIVAAVLTLTACSTAPGSPQTASRPSAGTTTSTASVSPSATVSAPSSPTASPTLAGGGLKTWWVPDQHLTPGEIKPHCTIPVAADRAVNSKVRKAVLARYHYSGPTDVNTIELDHRVPHFACGSDGELNLSVEPYDGVKPSMYVHNRKDALELKVSSLMRSGKLTVGDSGAQLRAAQDIFLGDWRVAYCQLVSKVGC